jgi:hypothetical protein
MFDWTSRGNGALVAHRLKVNEAADLDVRRLGSVPRDSLAGVQETQHGCSQKSADKGRDGDEDTFA